MKKAGEYISEFKVNLVYTVSFKPAKATKCDPVSNKQTKI